jgi:hypothetical protein
MKILLLFFIITISEAKFLKTDVNLMQDRCLGSYVNNPMYNQYIIDTYSEKGFIFLKEANKYCSCAVKEVYAKLENKNWIDRAFLDKKPFLKKRDTCSTNSFSHNNIKIHYALKYYEFFYPKVDHFIEDKFVGGYKMVMGFEKWNNFKKCLSRSISSNCSKINSLEYTYTCIEESQLTNEEIFVCHNEKEFFDEDYINI